MKKQAILVLTEYTIKPMLGLTVFLLVYQPLSKWYGGVTYTWKMPLEFFLVVMFYYSVFFILKNNRYRIIVALLPIISFYLFYDYYFLSFGNVFKICDLSEVPELIDVLPFWQISVYVAIILHVLFVIVINLTKIWYRYLIPLFVFAFIILIVEINPNWYLVKLFEPYALEGVTIWSDKETAHNGYFTAMLYFQAMLNNSKYVAEKAYINGEKFEAEQAKLLGFIKEKNNSHNIHLVILESFFNPELLTKIKYSKPVYAKEFSELIAAQESAVISPVFGGKTSQAEFEALCGIPALHKYASIEFNAFTGNERAFCIPEILRNSGYRVVASNSYKPNNFNTLHAYKGIGFDEFYFPKQYTPKRETYLKLVDDTKFIFDGDLFKQNLEFVKSHLEKPKHPPLFNYLLGVYGHMPFIMDEKRHPIVIKAYANNKTLDNEYQRAVNQIFYRTQALTEYVKELIRLDSNSLIIIMGDHLPKFSGMEFYKDMNYHNKDKNYIYKLFALYVVDAQVVKKPDMHQYDLMNVIYDYITEGQYCQTHVCQRTLEQLNYQYNMNMARALR